MGVYGHRIGHCAQMGGDLGEVIPWRQIAAEMDEGRALGEGLKTALRAAGVGNSRVLSPFPYTDSDSGKLLWPDKTEADALAARSYTQKLMATLYDCRPFEAPRRTPVRLKKPKMSSFERFWRKKQLAREHERARRELAASDWSEA